MQQHTAEEGKTLYLAVRAGLVSQGSSLGKRCRLNGVDQSNALRALFGQWDGPKAQELRRRILSDAGLEDDAA